MTKLLFVFVLLFFSSCGLLWGTFLGIGYIPFFQFSSKNMKTTICNIEGKRIFLFGEDTNVPYFSFKEEYRVYHILSEDSTNKEYIATYKFPLTTGIGAIVENTDIAIVETQEDITIYYNREPAGGFVIEQNPFSKKLRAEFRDRLFYIKSVDGACYYKK
ncbi:MULTISPECIES: hypothetical protein [unclassified Fibrobacter]|uniref:hypothetical protein n=1 Tax=unclassified Fibrobacter TaxID=2634177 RepID=UPI00091BAD5A|nr:MULTISPECIES: hypothetical protein [unclassified Fibrobacter]SHK42487.1 hypothetical protein SAMN05720759_102421 [Fibrobacter sp. UWB12]SIN84893.1 hypothetical protein SAMN05720758_0224 [Fibrobacter sp. UWB11]